MDTVPSFPRPRTPVRGDRDPLVSVVVPTHDRARLLPRLLASVLGQDLADLELVVVDDGSQDDTSQVLRGCRDPRLRVVRHDRPRGVAQARNTGTLAATGRWVAWCDDDDVWSPAKLRLQLQALAAAPGTRWCNGGSADVDAELRLTRVRRCPDPARVAVELLRVNAVTGGGSGVLADRALALDLGGFDTRFSMYADWDMWARLAAAAPLAVVPRPLVGYVEHPGGMSRGRLDLALAEVDLLRGRLAALADRAGVDARLHDVLLGQWMIRQQNGTGRRRDRLVLPVQLARRGMVQRPRVPAYGVLSACAPSLLQARWQTAWDRDPVAMADAEGWLAGLRETPQRALAGAC